VAGWDTVGPVRFRDRIVSDLKNRERERAMATFSVGDHVRWNSEAGFVSGVITKVHTSDTSYKGHKRHCTPDDPQYEIKSDKTEHVAMHKGSALRRVE
jgi:hypothetical protein